MRTEALPLEPLGQAIQAAKETLVNLTHHLDHGSQYTSIAYNEKLADYGIKPSTGRVDDFYDNALARKRFSGLRAGRGRQSLAPGDGS